MTTLANEKQKEQRDKTSGKKKKGAAKPALGAAKVASKYVTVYSFKRDQRLTNVPAQA